MNMMTVNEFVRLLPGERLPLSWINAPPVYEPGTYRVVVYYRIDPEHHSDRGVADGVEEEIALLHELDLRSNEITVILKP